uniref:Ferritin n=1 Tax=Trichobilharzia regenti TaxID=157069 RepID=A0AA85K8P5_TRIRE|nr:unnamed protein product [Trichobilharzia regenti]
MSESQARQNFTKECEEALNKQINMELQAAYEYMAFSTYFDRDDVALPNAAEFFRNASLEEREHAEKLAKYVVKRGGRVDYSDIKAPCKTEFTGVEDAMNTALAMEKAVNEVSESLRDTLDDVDVVDLFLVYFFFFGGGGHFVDPST